MTRHGRKENLHNAFNENARLCSHLKTPAPNKLSQKRIGGDILTPNPYKVI